MNPWRWEPRTRSRCTDLWNLLHPSLHRRPKIRTHLLRSRPRRWRRSWTACGAWCLGRQHLCEKRQKVPRTAVSLGDRYIEALRSDGCSWTRQNALVVARWGLLALEKSVTSNCLTMETAVHVWSFYWLWSVLSVLVDKLAYLHLLLSGYSAVFAHLWVLP